MGLNYSEIKKINKEANAKDEIYSKLLSHPISFAIVGISDKLGITPNVLTTISFLLSIIGCGSLLFVGDYQGLITSWLILHFALVFDSADGQLARWKNIKSTWGAYLDVYTDQIQHRLLISTLAIRLGQQDETFYIIGLIVLSIQTLIIFDWQYKKLQLNTENKNTIYIEAGKKISSIKELIQWGLNAFHGYYSFLFVSFVFNKPEWFFYLTGSWFGLLLVKRFIDYYKYVSDKNDISI